MLLDELSTSAKEHEAIANAIAAGEPLMAQSAAENNWHNAADRLTRIIAQHGERGSWHAWTPDTPAPHRTQAAGRRNGA